jgi:alpha,alpha-trehalase
VAEATGDWSIVDENYAAARAEHAWWMRTHSVHLIDTRGQIHVLNRYVSAQLTPRPESYREDVATAARSGLTGPNASVLYSALAGICESGWDFSSRWLGDGGRLETARPQRVIPADLNAFLLRAETLLEKASSRLGLTNETESYRAAAAARSVAIDTILWDDSGAQWRDGVAADTMRAGSADAPWRLGSDIVHATQTAASNYFPLWAGLGRGDAARVRRIVASLSTGGLLAPGGVMATTRRTGEQWDAPSAWAPVAAAIVDGLRESGEPSAAELARELARRWLKTAHSAWAQHGVMFEKYDAVDGGSGGGGEYAPEEGFGWTNGVTAKFAVDYDFEDLEEA